jgi:hypothetical protein
MAGKMLEKFLAMDSSFPTLVDVTQIASQGTFKSTSFANCLLYWRWTPFYCLLSNSFVATKVTSILMAWYWLHLLQLANQKNT